MTFEEFCDDPRCRECNDTMELNPGCEWSEDPQLWLCSSCCYNSLEKAQAENAALVILLEKVLAQIEDPRMSKWEYIENGIMHDDLRILSIEINEALAKTVRS